MKCKKNTKREIETIVSCNYRNAAGAWAGGDTNVYVTLVPAAKVDARGWSDRQWSDNGKWSGNDAEYEVDVQTTWDRLPAGLRDADGMLTLSARRVRNKPGLWKATWCRQGRGFALVVETGYVAQTPSGGSGSRARFTRGKSEKDARRKAARRSAATA